MNKITCLIGSGTRYLQVVFTIFMAVASEIRWRIEIYIGFKAPIADLIAYNNEVKSKTQ